MSHGLTPLLKASIGFAYIGGFAFLAVGVYLTYRRRRLHPLLLVCIAAISISWIEAPYDWAVYAQFAPAIPRMPSWWPLDMTWGGLPASVPIGYISYFVTPALVGAALGRRLSSRFHWRRPTTLLTVGLVVGFLWAFLFNGILGARLGVFYYGRVIPGLALWQGTKHQYPLYDALAMGVMVMVFAYHPRTNGCRRTHRHRNVGRHEVAEPPRINRPVRRRCRRHRKPALRRGLRAPPRGEVGGSGDRRTHGPLVPGRAEPAASGRHPPGSLTDRPTDRDSAGRTAHRPGPSHLGGPGRHSRPLAPFLARPDILRKSKSKHATFEIWVASGGGVRRLNDRPRGMSCSIRSCSETFGNAEAFDEPAEDLRQHLVWRHSSPWRSQVQRGSRTL